MKRYTPWNKGKTGVYSEEALKKMSETKRGEKNPNFGKHFYCSEETKMKLRESQLGRHHSQEVRNLIGLAGMGRKPTAETRKRLSEVKKGILNPNFGKKYTKEEKKNLSQKLKKLWQNPDFASRQIFLTMKGNRIKPNKPEEYLINLLNKILSDEYKYVGDGQFILAGKCPDFVNINGQKKIIELYGDYWHKNDNPQDRIDLFAGYGYQTLIIWEKELRNQKSLKKRILDFHLD